MLNDGTNQYLYDGEGRLCAVQTPTALTGYVYDGLGTRVAKGSISSFNCNVLTNGFTPSAEYIVGLNGEQLGETDGGYNLLHSNVFAGGHLLATYENSNWYYALNDWLGTKRVEANADGSVAAAFVSLPFGDGLDQQVSGPDATEHHFTGRERDAETGNDYFGARYYGSTMGRFLSPDYSDTPEAMPYADLSNPQSFNRYVYLNNNPLSGNWRGLLCSGLSGVRHYSPRSERPGWLSGLRPNGQWNKRSDSVIGTSLILACRWRMIPLSSNAQFSFP